MFVYGLLVLLLVKSFCTAESISEEFIVDVNKGKLDKLLNTSGYTAVYWYARNCKRSEIILKELEKIDDDAKKSGITFAKINDKRFGKSFGIKKFPALSLFRGRDAVIYHGDLKDEEEVLDFLTDEENLAMPDKIEDVNAEELLDIIEQDPLVAVFFYDESKASAKALEYMENIDEETDIFNIRFLRIKDPELVYDFSLTSVPSLVYFRHEIPVVYEGDLSDESEMLEWLIQQRSGADDKDEVELVNQDQLDIMVRNVDSLLVLFVDNTRMSNKVFDVMETIDDDCDAVGVSFVAVRDRALAARYTIDEFPSLVYFEQEIPSVFDGDLENGSEVLTWVVDLLTGADIEEVTNEILDRFISTRNYLAVLFFKEGEEASNLALQVLEEIDDDLDELGIMFVKIDDEKEAEEYGISNLPAIVVFENGIPNLYDGVFVNGEDILEWIVAESSGDHTIESVTDNMLDTLVLDHDHVAVVFYQKNDPLSQEVLESLEHIDDDAVNFEFPIKLVRMDDKHEAEEYGIEQFPTLVYFDKMIPNIYSGNLLDNQELLTWMTEQASGSHIEDISNEILEMLIRKHDDVTVFFYTKGVKGEARLVEGLEEVDHILEEDGIPLVRIDDPLEADKWGLEVVPGIIHFQYKEPHIFKGDLTNVKKIVEWVIETRNS